MKNRYKFIKEFCPALKNISDYSNKDLKMNHQYMDDVIFEIMIQGVKKPLINRLWYALKRRKQITDFQDNQIDNLLAILA